MDFEALVSEGAAVPLGGWDFSWFNGRATEQRPSWGYATLLARRLSRAGSALDLQTGGGEVFAWALRHATRTPRQVAATEAWSANTIIAKDQLNPLGVSVVLAANEDPLPFRDAIFDLVSARHPIEVHWEHIARALKPGGVFVSQMIGPGSNRELYEYLMGPQPDNPQRTPEAAVAGAAAAGLHLLDLRSEALEVAFFDVGAVVHFLRKVPWTVPDFTVERYHDRLLSLHGDLQRDGRFVSHSQRYLIELRN